MATGIVPYEKKERIYTAKCLQCGCLYIPEKENDMLYPDGTIANFEPCPECGYELNGKTSIIPQWQYKFIRFYRSLRKTSTKPPATNDSVRVVVSIKDKMCHSWYGGSLNVFEALQDICKKDFNGELEPYLIVRSDRSAVKRNKVVKRRPSD